MNGGEGGRLVVMRHPFSYPLSLTQVEMLNRLNDHSSEIVEFKKQNAALQTQLDQTREYYDSMELDLTL
jgi:hypothetical protein